jgi:hypothetical protein
MLGALKRTCLMGCLLSVSVPLTAQAVVHALTGTVSAIDSATKTITVFQDDGVKGVFEVMSNPKTSIAFDKKIAAGTTAASAFNKSGAYVIVFYFGDIHNPTVAAFKSLGTGPFTSIVGKVEKFESSGHSISVADNSGKVQTFRIGADTVAETISGVEAGLKFHAQAGDQVRVVGGTVNGDPTAMFLKEM